MCLHMWCISYHIHQCVPIQFMHTKLCSVVERFFEVFEKHKMRKGYSSDTLQCHNIHVCVCIIKHARKYFAITCGAFIRTHHEEQNIIFKPSSSSHTETHTYGMLTSSLFYTHTVCLHHLSLTHIWHACIISLTHTQHAYIISPTHTCTAY